MYAVESDDVLHIELDTKAYYSKSYRQQYITERMKRTSELRLGGSHRKHVTRGEDD